jgi:hypothetical protein
MPFSYKKKMLLLILVIIQKNLTYIKKSPFMLAKRLNISHLVFLKSSSSRFFYRRTIFYLLFPAHALPFFYFHLWSSSLGTWVISFLGSPIVPFGRRVRLFEKKAFKS